MKLIGVVLPDLGSIGSPHPACGKHSNILREIQGQ